MHRFTSDRQETKHQHICSVHIEDSYETVGEVARADDENAEDECIYANNIYEEIGSDENVSEGNAAEKNVAEENVFADNVDEINVYENVNEEKVAYEPAGNEELVEIENVHLNERADENEQVDESDLDTERSSMNDSDATPLQTTLVWKWIELIEKFRFFKSNFFFSPNHVLFR